MDNSREFTFYEGQLIWSRFNAMVVAHAVLIGFISQAALSDAGAEVYDITSKMVVVVGCVAGAQLALVWWRITSVGWSLQHAWLNKVKSDKNDVAPKEVYEKWTKRFLFSSYQDPIWWCAHAVIAIFFFAYLSLFLYFSNEANINKYLILAIFVAAIVLFALLLFSSLTTLNIRDEAKE